MRDSLKKMKRVLRRLGHVNAENVVLTKGRVTCEVNSADELLVTELIFSGAFNDLDAGHSVREKALAPLLPPTRPSRRPPPRSQAALLSCLVYTEKGDPEADPLPEDLAAPLRLLQEAARRIAQGVSPLSCALLLTAAPPHPVVPQAGCRRTSTVGRT